METIEICNLAKRECYITLKDGEYICPKCSGRGGQIATAYYKSQEFTLIRCMICGGDGKVDWIIKARMRPTSKPELMRLSFKCRKSKNCKTLKRILKKENWQKEFEQMQRKRVKEKKKAWKTK